MGQFKVLELGRGSGERESPQRGPAIEPLVRVKSIAAERVTDAVSVTTLAV